MKDKLYIKFEEWNKESLDKAVKEAKRLGYKKFDGSNALDFEWRGLLCLSDRWNYFTSWSGEEYLEADWYIEHKIETLVGKGYKVIKPYYWIDTWTYLELNSTVEWVDENRLRYLIDNWYLEKVVEILPKIFIRFGWEWEPTKQEAIDEFIRLGYKYNKTDWGWNVTSGIMVTQSFWNEFFPWATETWEEHFIEGRNKFKIWDHAVYEYDDQIDYFTITSIDVDTNDNSICYNNTYDYEKRLRKPTDEELTKYFK